MKERMTKLVVLIIPLLSFFPYLNDFIYQARSSISDLSISHYPNAAFLKTTLLSGYGIPFWSPTILSGYPFGADPLSGLWYPPGWIPLFFSIPLGFNLAILLHLFWGGVGTYLMLRALGIKVPASLVGAIVFEAFPKLLTHFAAGHITLVYAVCWAPWLLLAELNWKGGMNWKRLWAAPGVVLGIIALADIRFAALAGLFWLAYVLFEKRKIIWMPLIQIGLALLVSAPLLLPLLQFAQLATRSGMTPADSFTLSLPPENLIGLLYPQIGGYAEWVLYPGALTLVLTITLLISTELRKRYKFWLFVILIALFFSLGSNIPFLSYLALIPGFDLLRVPSRAYFLTGLPFAVLAAACVDVLSDHDQLVKIYKRGKQDPFLAGLAMFAMILPIGIFLITRSFPLGFFWGAVGILIAVILMMLRLHNRISGSLFGVIAIVFVLIDLVGFNFLSLQPLTPVSVLSEGGDAAAYLSKFTGLFRVYSPSYSIPQQTAEFYHLQLADGIDPLQLSSYAKFMEKADGVPETGYSVTLPPFAKGDPQNDNQLSVPDARQLGLLNIKYIASAFNLTSNGLTLIAQFGATRIYENRFALPRAWIQPVDSKLGSDIQPAAIDFYSPNEVDLTGQGPGQLVLSEVMYPGWQVWIDGEPAKINTVAGLLRGVDLPVGAHQIKFLFRPWFVYIGIAIGILTWAGILGATIFMRRKHSTGA